MINYTKISRYIYNNNYYKVFDKQIYNIINI